MLAWQGPGTNLPADFAALRVETNELQISAEVRLPHAGRDSAEADRVRAETAVQLLCRALRLAPEHYRRFELAAEDTDRPLQIGIVLSLVCGVVDEEDDSDIDPADIDPAEFDDAAGLVAAMQQHAAAEGLSVTLSPDMDSVIVCRASN